tara:strand:+ start:820 stop:2214 length:1395 start_codon:yes stop_codon:yes gene_type:complete
MSDDKFEFTTEYQWNLLKYTVKDRDGVKALELYNDSYFTLNEHSIIAHSLKNFHKKTSRIPREPSLLKEELRELLKTRDYSELFTNSEQENLMKDITKLYREDLKDGDLIFEKCIEFVRYINVKDTVEKVNLLNFNDYKGFAKRIQKAIETGNDLTEDYGTMLINDIKERQFNRQDNRSVIPTPFYQINNATNAGGYDKGSIIVILDRPKKFKTGMAINIARGYLRMKKKTLVIDLENGQDSYAMRLEQSIVKKPKQELLSGQHDDKIQKTLRKYKRLGGEIVIKRLPALTTTTHDIQALMDYYYREHGIQFDNLVMDYAALLASTTNKQDDHNRIADAYLDLSNLAIANQLDHIWTPHHVPKNAFVREESRYNDSDLAKCTEIGRHVHAIWGLNRDDDEEENNIMRMELVVQRDGAQRARALFNVDYPTQRADEFNKAQLREYNRLNRNDDSEDNKPERETDL